MLPDIIRSASYFNAPDGTDPFGKVVGMSKWAAAIGFGLAARDITVNQLTSVPDVLGRMTHYVFPITAMGATFATTVYIATDLRKKDDKANYVLASLATGGVFHAWMKKGLVSMYATLALMGVSCYFKYKHQSGKNIWFKKEFVPQYRPPAHEDYWTYIEDPRKSGWKPLTRDWI